MSITVTTRAKSGHADDWEYCGVKLTIHNIVIPDEKRCPTPSQLDNMDPELETDLRIVGCELIQDSGILLRLPQVALATAQVLYQRFFYSKSFVRHFYEHYAMACIFLAAKLEECPRRIRDVINVFHHIRQIREQRIPTPVMLDQSYSNLKNQVIKAERRLLKELGFCVHAKHPHKLIICYLQALEQEKNAKFVQCAWNYMNDSLRTDLFVRYLPEAIACACIYLASCKLGIPLPRHPAWWEMFAVDEESVREISLCLVRLYARPKPCVAELEAELAKLRKNQMEAKERELELKKVPAGSTPNLGSDQGSINVSPASVTVSEKLSLPSHDGGPLKTDEVKPFRDDRVLPPNSVLASAIATAKAVAANISATKGASDINRKSNSSSPTVPEHKRTSETSEPTRNDMGKKRESPETTSRKPNKYSLDIAPGRPAAYPNVSPEPLASRKRRHPESLTDAEHSKGNVSQNPFNQINSRHYRRRRLNAQESVHSTSGSDTPTSSLSPAVNAWYPFLIDRFLLLQFRSGRFVVFAADVTPIPVAFMAHECHGPRRSSDLLHYFTALRFRKEQVWQVAMRVKYVSIAVTQVQVASISRSANLRRDTKKLDVSCGASCTFVNEIRVFVDVLHEGAILALLFGLKLIEH
ncbi:cyclin-L2 [Clonorchis sinensis]|uniref:Cyclin-L2 n=1 Tax=Clonorchis sinensis TaxID=79923 RepID=H2KP81_CLOSI|nr:cyclin-L2 [Clonorchis sinensis]